MTPPILMSAIVYTSVSRGGDQGVSGNSGTHVDLCWWQNDEAGQGAAARELSYSKGAWQFRRSEESETVPAGNAYNQPAPPCPAWLDRKGTSLLPETYAAARGQHRSYAVEAEWRNCSITKGTKCKPGSALLGLLHKYAVAHPLEAARRRVQA
ncbi:MAG: hypothetical protein AAF681_07570 [Pseudomonadota bacterium]